MNESYQNSEPQGMKWHNFQIYFSTWANAVSSIILGVIAIAAAANDVYFSNSDNIFAAFLGVALIALGIYFIYVRSALADFRRGAPNHLLVAGLLSALFAGLFSMLDMGADFSTIISALPVPILTRIYYAKRAHLFE